MTEISDPARELADLCSKLSVETNKPGETFLSGQFNTTAWTAEFFEIIFVIVERIENLKTIVSDLEMDADIKSDAIRHLNSLSSAFAANSLNNPWRNVVVNHLNATNIQPIKMLSSEVRKKYQLPKLSETERADLLAELDIFLSWLEEHQISERDFVRQALIDGVRKFKFRLERLQWVGWGYSLESFREVIAAYMILERAYPDTVASPDAGAILLKAKSIIVSIYEKTKLVKETTEVADFALRLYGATVMAAHGTNFIAGLLSHAG